MFSSKQMHFDNGELSTTGVAKVTCRPGEPRGTASYHDAGIGKTVQWARRRWVAFACLATALISLTAVLTWTFHRMVSLSLPVSDDQRSRFNSAVIQALPVLEFAPGRVEYAVVIAWLLSARSPTDEPDAVTMQEEHS